MDVRILRSKGSRLEFVLEDSTAAFANALRRAMITEVPVLAVDWADFEENGSALFDETIAHRLAMLPLEFNPKKLNVPDECPCKGAGCTNCQVVLALEKTGPGTATSGDLKSTSRDVRPTDANFPIVQLIEGQRLKFQAVARLGFGRTHAKYQAANATYQFYPVISKARPEEELEPCPRGIVELKDGKPVIPDMAKLELSAACKIGDYKVTPDPTKFLFRVESISGLEPEYIVEAATQALIAKAGAFRAALKKV